MNSDEGAQRAFAQVLELLDREAEKARTDGITGSTEIFDLIRAKVQALAKEPHD